MNCNFNQFIVNDIGNFGQSGRIALQGFLFPDRKQPGSFDLQRSLLQLLLQMLMYVFVCLFFFPGNNGHVKCALIRDELKSAHGLNCLIVFERYLADLQRHIKDNFAFYWNRKENQIIEKENLSRHFRSTFLLEIYNLLLSLTLLLCKYIP